MHYWLVKSEADCYSIDDLQQDKTTIWNEVRNYQARNFLREMKKGDLVLFYHSNGGKETGVVGEVKVSKEAYPDPTQFAKNSEYYDPKSTPEDPRWSAVDIQFVTKFSSPVYLSDLKLDPAFETLGIVQRGSRLSVLPVSKKHYEQIVQLGKSNK